MTTYVKPVQHIHCTAETRKATCGGFSQDTANLINAGFPLYGVWPKCHPNYIPLTALSPYYRCPLVRAPLRFSRPVGSVL